MRYLYLVLVFAVLIGAFTFYKGFSKIEYKKARVSLSGHSFLVDVADDTLTKARGLGGRESLAADEGMLFVFGRPTVRSFWMQDMLIPIDIIWISGGEVIGFEEEVQPEPGTPVSKMARYRSPGLVDYVLEIRSGGVRAAGVKEGDKVNVSFE